MKQLMQILTAHRNAILLLAIFCCTIRMAYAQNTIVEAQNGVIDLRDFDFDNASPAEIGGDWLFLWNTLTTNEDSIRLLGDKITIARVSSEQKKYPSYGFGTYMVKIHLNPKYQSFSNQNQLGLRIGDIFSSYRLYINGELLAQKGVVAEKEADQRPQMGYETVFFTPTSSTLTLIIHVSNYLNPNDFGLYERIKIGSQKQILKATLFKNYMFIISFGVMLMFLLYHMVFFLLRRNEKENLYFAIICGLFAIKCLFEGDKMIFYLFPSFSTIIYYKLWFICVVILFFLVIFYNRAFPLEVKKWLVNVSLIVFGLFTISIIVLPTSYGFISAKIIYLFSLPLIIYACSCIGVAVWRKRSYAWPNFVGVIVPTVFAINDLLYALNFIETGYYSALGFLFYIVTQSAILSFKSAKAFHNVEKLTNELANANQNLEKLVDIRTRELNDANILLQQTNATKDRFFTILAHDLRGPISTIRSLLEMITLRHESYSKEKITHMITVLSESSRSTYDLLDNLLNWAKAQRKEMIFTQINCNLFSISQDTVALLLPSAQSKAIVLVNEIPDPLIMYCDKNMITTVIRNIINNAIKFTPPEGTIHISANENEKGIEIIITDTGVGMSESAINSLFNNDVVLQSTHGTAGEKGSGLGLVLCREFVAQHNGWISVKSTIDVGTSFCIFIPQNNSTFQKS